MTDIENTIAPELLNDERALRLSKREDYIARGVNPYPEHSEVTDYVRDIVAKYADLATGEDTEDVVKIGGRIVAKRGQGKIMFLVVRDTTADIQLFCRINDMSEADWELLRNLDLGDIVASSPSLRAPLRCFPKPCVRFPRSSTVSLTKRPAIVSATLTSL